MTPQERLRAWGAEPTGEVWTTGSSYLIAGRRGAVPVMLKVARIEEERRGGRLLAWWSLHGGLPVLEHDDDAVLMLRATGRRSLLGFTAAGRDDEAEDVLAETAVALHALPAPPASVGLVSLRTWFRALTDHPQKETLLVRAAGVARDLLEEPGPVVALHGDLHHGNVLDLGDRWAAIDPKGLVGHPAFDIANVFCNPSEEAAITRLDRRLARFADRLGLERQLLAAWVIAWCGLSVAWSRGVPSWHDRAAREVATQLLGVVTSRW
jgi:streptomycin 6-kinase